MAKKLSKGSLLGFLRSRPYVSIADIRRRFSIEADEVTPLRAPEGYAYVGLPPAPAEIVRQLWSEGKIGLHFSPDIRARSVEGLYATRLDFGQREAPPAKNDHAAEAEEGKATEAEADSG